MKYLGIFVVALIAFAKGDSSKSCTQALEELQFQKVSMDTCQMSKAKLENAIDGCRIDRSEHALGRLRILIQQLSQADCLGAVGNKPECASIFQSATEVLNTKGFSMNKCESQVYQDFEDDMVQAQQGGQCQLAKHLLDLVRSGWNKVCNGPLCVTNDGVYDTEPDTKCQKYTQRLVDGTGRKFDFKLPFGTMFDVTICQQSHVNESNCRNSNI